MMASDMDVDDIKSRVEGLLQRMAMLYGWSQQTVAAYRNDMFAFVDFLHQQGISRHAFDATQADVTAHVHFLQQQQLSSSSIQRKRSALATWFHYLQNEKIRDDFPMLHIALIRPSLRLPKHMSEAEVEAILAAPDVTTHKGIRDRCLLELMYATGLRVSELAGIKKANFNHTQKTLRVIGKGNKEREIPYGDVAALWLDAWLDVSKTTSVFLFPSRKSSLTRQTLWRLVHEYAAQAGVYPLPSPHTLRHAFATHLLNHGANLRAVQTLLGHENITTTEIYTHVSRAQLHDEVNKSHPMGRKNG